MKSKWAALAFAATVLPALLPLALVHHYYNSDWFTHLWPTSFIAGAIRFSHTIPATISAQGRIASYPNIPYYGYLLYTMAGVLGAIFDGGEAGLRTACALALVAQFIVVYKATRTVSGSAFWAALTAGIVSTAIYPLTALYHRAAVPEFFTGCFVTCSLCCWTILLQARSRKTLLVWAPWFALFLANAAGSHPITSLYAVVVLAPTFLISLPALRRMSTALRPTFWAVVGLALALALLIDGSLLYSLVKLSPKIGAARLASLTFMDYRGDSWWVRLLPFPFDKASLISGTHIPTPYLDLQLNMPLLALLAIAIAVAGLFAAKRTGRSKDDRDYKPWLLFSGLAFVALSVLSVSEGAWKLVPHIFQIVQFPYRLINYANAMALAMLLAVMSLRPQKFTAASLAPWLGTALTAVATVALCALGMKLLHVGATKTDKRLVGAPANESWQEVYKDYASLDNYTLAGLPILPLREAGEAAPVVFPLASAGSDFGRIGDVGVNLAKPTWIVTTLAAHDWNELSVDGVRVPLSQLYYHDARFALKLGAGHHDLHVDVRPDATWLMLREISYLTLLFVLLTCVFMAGFAGKLAEKSSRIA